MAERIVSPGVFTREKDLSFLPAGVASIGAAIVGPTVKGPSFVPTQVSSLQEFEDIFGNYTKDYYTPYTVREYLRSAGSVTVVKVGYLGGYKANAVNVVVSGSGATKFVVGQILPAIENTGGLISASIEPAALGVANNSASLFNFKLHGSNATASLSNVSILSTAFANSKHLTKKVPGEADNRSIEGVSAAGYLYKYFRGAVSQSQKDGLISGTVGKISFEILAAKEMDFESATQSTNSSTYERTYGGSSNALAARTPYIQDQDGNNLFRIYSRVDGTASNNYYVQIYDVKPASATNTAADYAEFNLQLYRSDGNPVGAAFQKLNFDPASPSFLPKAIGDQFQEVDNSGNINVFGEYANRHSHIRVGDYNSDNLKSKKNAQPMGFAPVIEPIISTASVPTASLSRKQVSKDNPTAYNVDVAYGSRVSDLHFSPEDRADAVQYLAPIPNSANKGSNVAFNLVNEKGFGAGDSLPTLTELTEQYGSTDRPWASAAANLSISSSAQQLKFAVPFQYGFDGIAPNAVKNTGNDITATNTMGFDCSSATASGSIAWRRAINAVSNPDEIDINMLSTPGIIHSLHPSVTNHAISKMESRADAFYVMDGSAWAATVAAAVDNVKTLDTNYVATYFPWVKIDDPDTNEGVWVPPSVVIPGVIAFTDSVAHEWFAPAGLNRGGLSSVRMAKKKLTHTDRDRLYDGRVNPIATFPGQGVVVFGQKTLQAKPSALDRINVRRLLIRLKKFIASSSRFLVFEQNDSSTRTRFLNIVNPFLESVQANSGLSAFKVVMDESNNTPDVIDRNQLVGQIFIQPTRTAEFIVLDFSVLPTGAAFPE